jgi:hypothetical protein
MENQTSEVKTLSSEDLKELRSLQERSSYIISELGQIELIKFQIEERRKQAEEQLINLKKNEEDFSTKLYEKYGDCTIDPSTGEISYNI